MVARRTVGGGRQNAGDVLVGPPLLDVPRARTRSVAGVVQIVGVSEPPSQIANVAGARDQVARDLPLQGQVEGLLVAGPEVCSEGAEGSERCKKLCIPGRLKGGEAGRERVARSLIGIFEPYAEPGDLRAERRRVDEAVVERGELRVPEQAPAAAHDRFTTRQTPGKSEARRDLLPIRVETSHGT